MNRRHHNKRKRAKVQFPALMQKFRGRCAYCQCEVIPVQFIAVEDRIKETAHWITATINGEQRTVRKASVDHSTKLADGGNNHFLNLVLACVKCNGQKDRMHKHGKAKVKTEARRPLNAR